MVEWWFSKMIFIRNTLLVSIIVIFLIAMLSWRLTFIKQFKSENYMCLALGMPCLNSEYQCCPLIWKGGITGLSEVTCSKFGKRICREVESIPNYAEYSMLVQQLNSTNFEELKETYWASVAAETQRSLTTSPSIEKSAKHDNCLPLGSPCMTSEFPCCEVVRNMALTGLSRIPTTCFKFGQGICQVDRSIQNFDYYKRLAQQLNSTNFQYLKNRYWVSVAPTIPRSSPKPPVIDKPPKLTKCLPLKKPCLKSKYPCCKWIGKIGFMRQGLFPGMAAVTCFKFGTGACELKRNIINYEEYNKLAQQLNSTNFHELKEKYWNTVKEVKLITKYP